MKKVIICILTIVLVAIFAIIIHDLIVRNRDKSDECCSCCSKGEEVCIDMCCSCKKTIILPELSE